MDEGRWSPPYLARETRPGQSRIKATKKGRSNDISPLNSYATIGSVRARASGLGTARPLI